jgi:hypothetical protein
MGALRLAPMTYRDIERDPRALLQAAGLVSVAGAARGLGAIEHEGVVGLVGSIAVGLVTWLGAGGLIWMIGDRRFSRSSTFAEVMRTVGFAAAPLLVLALRALPLGAADSLIWIGAHAWATLALATAAREALDINTGQALVVCLLSLIAGFALLVVVGMLVGHWGAFD